MNNRSAAVKPAVKIFYCGIDPRSRMFQEMLFGIEEEGIPFELAEAPTSTASNLGYQAGQESRLGVGIGVSGTTAVLHFEKLRPEKPLFTVELSGGEEKARALGANGARLVKQIPFKEL